MYTENHLPNQLNATEHFEKVIFPDLDQIKENMVYPNGYWIWENFAQKITVRLWSYRTI